MKVIAFVGPSGTGKSYRASVVAHESGIDCIIDDGILIYQNRLAAGFSAKKEESRLKAVRRAIFQDPVQVASVQKALAKINPKKLLILGTSERMVDKITLALGLPKPRRYIHIEQVATREEIARANESRLKEGKHIIPLPTMELRPHFRGYLIDPLKSFFRRDKNKKAQGPDEKSVVRPIFSYYGKLVFSDAVIIALLNRAVEVTRGAISAHDVKITKMQENTNGLGLEFSLVMAFNHDPKRLIQRLQKAIRHEIEYTTGMSVQMLKISIRDMVNVQRR